VVPNTGSKEQDNLVLPSQTASQTEMPSVELLGQIGSRALHNLVAWWFDKRGERLPPDHKATLMAIPQQSAAFQS
jgi:hypothetical protein